MKKLLILLVFLLSLFALIFVLSFQGKSKRSVKQLSTPSPLSISETKETDIFLSSPLEGDFISSPLKVSGEAKGSWYFEGSFPVVLTDWDGKIIAEGVATATTDWMSEELVPFTADIAFEKPAYGQRGSLILRRDNPSGLPQNDKALEITIFFK